MAKEPDNRIDDLVKEFKDFRADERKRSDENAKSMSDMKVQQSEFKSRFNTLMGVLAGAVGLVVLLTSTITKIVFDQNAHSASTDTRLSTIESHLSTLTDKTNTIAEAAQKQPHQIKSVADAVDDLKNIVPSLTDAVLSGQKDQNTLFIFSSSPDRIMDRLSGPASRRRSS